MYIEIENTIINADEILSAEKGKKTFKVYMIKRAGQDTVFSSYWEFKIENYPTFKSKMLQCGKEIY